MRCQFDSECVTNERGKDNMGPGAEDEEVVLKKQKPWVKLKVDSLVKTLGAVEYCVVSVVQNAEHYV